MYKGYRIGATLLLGGVGSRFGGPTPKQFCLLEGRPIYFYALETFLKTAVFDEIILVCHSEWIEKIAHEITDSRVRFVTGGRTRQESSLAGLLAFSEPLPEIVSIHDAVRPFVSQTILFANLDTAIHWEAANTCLPCTDTLVFAPDKKHIASIPKREAFFRGQTPQTFRYDLIKSAHAHAKNNGIANASDDCQLVLTLGHPVAIVQGNEENLKITSEIDLHLAKAIYTALHQV